MERGFNECPVCVLGMARTHGPVTRIARNDINPYAYFRGLCHIVRWLLPVHVDTTINNLLETVISGMNQGNIFRAPRFQVQSLYHYILHLFYLSRQIAFLPFIFTDRIYPLFSLCEPSYISSPLPVDKNIKRDNQGIILLFSSKYKRRCINVIFQPYKHNINAVF